MNLFALEILHQLEFVLQFTYVEPLRTFTEDEGNTVNVHLTSF